jgi:hypothetical protein
MWNPVPDRAAAYSRLFVVVILWIGFRQRFSYRMPLGVGIWVQGRIASVGDAAFMEGLGIAFRAIAFIFDAMLFCPLKSGSVTGTIVYTIKIAEGSILGVSGLSECNRCRDREGECTSAHSHPLVLGLDNCTPLCGCLAR